MDQIKAVFTEEHTEAKEETYDIYLLPPGEDPESCQSYLRMRDKDGKYSLMFEVCFSKLNFCVLCEMRKVVKDLLRSKFYLVSIIRELHSQK